MNGPGEQSTTIVSIIVVHYRSPDLLERCLAHIAAAKIAIATETLILDNAPLDDQAQQLADRFGARYVRNERNVGYGRAINQGMAAARGRYYLILNPDVEVGADSVERLAAHLEAHPGAGMVGPKLFSPDGSLQYSARRFYTLRAILLRRTPLGRLFPRARALREHLMLDWDHDEVREVDWMLGGAIMVRRTAVADVGGMDERFFLYFEDVDWCSRMHQRGWRVVYIPDAHMVHAHQRASARGFLSRGQRMHLESALRFYEKWSMVLYLWKKQATQVRAILTLAADITLLSIAFLGAYFTRWVLQDIVPGWSGKEVLDLKVYARFIGFADLVAIGTFYFLGLYRGIIWRDRWCELIQMIKGITITMLVVMATTLLFTTGRPLSRFTILLFFPYGLVLVALGRDLLRRLVREARARKLHLRRLAVFAAPEQIELLRERFRIHGTFGFEPLYLSHDDERSRPREEDPDPVERRIRFIENERIAEVAVFESSTARELLDRLMPGLLASGIPVRFIPRAEALVLDAHRMGDFMGFGALALGGRGRPVGSWAKRSSDALLAALLLLIASPLHLVLWLRHGRGRLPRVALCDRTGQPLHIPRYSQRAWLLARLPALRYYPALPHVIRGELSFVGLAPLTPGEWAGAEESYRLNPPGAPPGLIAEGGGVGAWLGPEGSTPPGHARPLAPILTLNRRYVRTWSFSEDVRMVFTEILRARKHQEGSDPS